MSNIIWTNHAKERNKQRQITEKWVEQTVNSPDETRPLEDGKTEYKKKFDNQTVAVVTTKSREGKYLILSTWINPPTPGTLDYKNKEYSNKIKRAGSLRKIWTTFLHQIGL